MKKTVLLTIAAAFAALSLAACSADGGVPTATPTSSDDIQGGVQPTTTQVLSGFPASAELDEWCPRDVDAVHLHQPSADVIDAVVCVTGDDDAGMTTVTVSKVTGGLENLLVAYAKPNAGVDPGASCIEPIVDPLAVWLSYPGERSYPVYAPVDACGFPTDEAKASFAALELTPVVSFTDTSTGVTTTDIGLGSPGVPAKETT